MSFLSNYLPSDTWTLLVVLALINSTLLLLLLTNQHRSLPVGGIYTYNVVSILISVITTIETYLQMATYERSYFNRVASDVMDIASASTGSGANGSGSGISLNTSRFRSQRNFYLSFFTLLLSVLLHLTTRLVNHRDEIQSKLYKLQREIDRNKSQ